MKIRTRFAPSPTGFMHIGNLRTALYAYLFAKKHKGDFILRIEDTDRQRLVSGAVEKIYTVLHTVGLAHDEGPDIGGKYGPYTQSQRKKIYIQYAHKLIERGGAYYCFCNKERISKLADEKGVIRYDKKCLSLSQEEIQAKIQQGEPYVIRQNLPTKGESRYTDLVYGEITVPNKELEDNILIKTDGMPTYNFANVIDDHLMKINYVIRGIEYLSSTPKYNYIYKCFGWEEPKYIHLPHIMKDSQRKLSKRYGDANFEDYIKKGYLPEAILNYIALLGWSPKGTQEKLTLNELIKSFDIAGISKSASIFDEKKMKWLNSQYIREMKLSAFNELAIPYYKQVHLEEMGYRPIQISNLLQNRIELLSEIPDKVAFLKDFGAFNTDLYTHKKMKTDKKIALLAIKGAQKAILKINASKYNGQEIMQALTIKGEEIGMKKRQMLYCVRVAITGRAVTPGGAIEIAELLGKKECLRRLKKSEDQLIKEIEM